MLYTIRHRVIINRPIEVVFAFVTDPTTAPQWQTNLLHSEVLTPGRIRTGTQIRETRQVGRAKKQAVWEIITYEPPIKRNCTRIDQSGPFRQTKSLLFTFVQEKTLLQSTTFIETHFPYTCFLPLLRHRLHTRYKRDFARLKQLLEAERA